MEKPKAPAEPAESSISHVSKVASSPEPAAPPIPTRPRTEAPKEPEHVYHAFEVSKVEPTPIGCDELILEYKLSGQLGTFYDRDKSTRYKTSILMDIGAYRTAAYRVLKLALERLLYLKDHIDSIDINAATTRYANDLADGIMIATYYKLRTVSSLLPEQVPIFHRKPKAPTSFEVPAPYALAISQLGQVRVSGLPTDYIYMPSMSQDDGNRFGLAEHRRWSSVSYGRAVEYAKRLGMRFSYADLNVKLGSTWWLLRPHDDAGRFTLQCPLPEENFTTNMAALASLFCITETDNPYNPIFNLDPLGTNVFGTMLRDPHDQIAVSTFFAINGDPSVTYLVT